MRRAIKASAIIFGEEMEILRNGYIVIEDEMIKEVSEGKSPNVDEVFSCEGCAVIPGLVNAHTHLGDAAFKDAGTDRSLEELFAPPHGLKYEWLKEVPRKKLVEIINETLTDISRLGITTVADFREGGAEGARMFLEALTDESPRTLILGQPDHPFTKEELESNKGLFSEDNLVNIGIMMDFVNGLAPSSPNDLTDGALIQLAEIARFYGKLKAIHAAENPKSREISERRTGSSEVERALKYFEADMLIHLTYASSEELDLIVENKASVVCCPRANAALGLDLPSIQGMLNRGIIVALGTDNVMVNAPDMFREMEFVAKVYRIFNRSSGRLDFREIFKMATINGAKALKMENLIGSVDEGKMADLVVIDFEDLNLRHTQNLLAALTQRVRSDNIKMVMVGGRAVYNRDRN